MDKECSKCLIVKNVLEFGVRKRSKDGLMGICRECKRKYDKEFHKNRPKECKQKKQNLMTKRRKDILKTIWNYAISIWCKDCGYNDNKAALQFDHKYNKTMAVSEMVRRGYSIENIMIEIKKCDVVCANCHHIRTAKQFNRY